MNVLFPSVVFTLTSSAILALIYLFLYKKYANKYWLIWTAGWSVNCLRFVFVLFSLFYGQTTVIKLFIYSSSLLNGVLLLWGIYEFSNSKFSFVWWIVALGVIGWIILATIASLPMEILTLPVFLFSAYIFIWAGIFFIKKYDPNLKVKYLLGVSFILWGLHKLDYPFLIGNADFATWGFMFAASLTLIISAGILILYFEIEHIKLSESEKSFKSIVESSEAVFFRINKDGVFTFSDGRGLKRLQLNPGEAVGKSCFEMYKDNPQIIENVNASLRGNRIHNIVEIGDYFFDSHYTPQFDNNGQVSGVIGVSFDFTDRIRQHQQILKLSKAVEQSQVSIVITDIEGRIEYINNKVIETTGYSKEELIGQNPRVLKSGYTTYEEYKNLWETIKAGNTWIGKFSNKRKNGEFYWESAVITPIMNENGRIINFLAVKEDITEKVLYEDELNKYRSRLEKLVEERTDQLEETNKKLELEIEKQKEYDKEIQNHINMLSIFIDSIPTAAFIKDSDLRYIEVNHAFEEMVEKDKKEIIGKTVYDVFDKKTASIIAQLDKDLIKTKKLEKLYFSMKKSTGKELYMLVTKVIYQKIDGSFGGILGTYIDLSEQKTLQDSIERSLSKERDLNELKSRFISMASHEFRTPLTSIKIFTEMISRMKDKNTTEKLDDYIEKIQNRVAYMTDLINDVLIVSRAETGKLKFCPETIDLKQFFEELISEFRLNISARHELIFDYNSKKRKVNVDPRLMQYIFSNLLTNAVKYSPEGGTIKLQCVLNDNEINITVSDDGIGISENIMKNLFEPFLRGDNIGDIPGTGLGLSIMKKALDLHKGEITCESKLNVGTIFKIILPLN